MRTSKRLRSIRTIIDELLQQYFRFGTETSKEVKVKDFEIDDIENPCSGCLVFPVCQSNCSDKTIYDLLKYLESVDKKPETYAITAVQKKGEQYEFRMCLPL